MMLPVNITEELNKLDDLLSKSCPIVEYLVRYDDSIQESEYVNNNASEMELKLISRLLQKKIAVELNLANPKKEWSDYANEVKTRVIQMFNVFSAKVSDKDVNHVVQYLLSKYPYSIAVSHINPFLFKVIYDINLATMDIDKIIFFIDDEDLFDEFLKEVKRIKEDNEAEIQRAVLEKLVDKTISELEQNITDYYYGLYLKYIVLSLALNVSKVRSDYDLHLLITKVIVETILKGFGKKYTTGLDDYKIALTHVVVLYLLLTHYFNMDAKNALETAAEIVAENVYSNKGDIKTIVKKFITDITNTIPKFNLLTDMKYLGVYLEKLGILMINPTQFLINISKQYGKYYSFAVYSYPYLVSIIIASLYPISDPPSVGSENTVKALKNYVQQNYILRSIK